MSGTFCGLPTGLRYDFGQTTLEGHSLAGEERFSVQWSDDDDSVWCAGVVLGPSTIAVQVSSTDWC